MDRPDRFPPFLPTHTTTEITIKENFKSFLLHFPDLRDLLIIDSRRLFAEPVAVAKAITTDFLRLPGPYAPDVAAAEARERNAVDDKCSSVLMGGKAAGEYRLREVGGGVGARVSFLAVLRVCAVGRVVCK